MLEQLIFYFTKDGNISKNKLINLLYLADLYAVKWTDKQLTDLVWYYSEHGFSTEIIDQIICSENKKDGFNFSTNLELILENITKEYVEEKDLLDYVYSTEPMIVARQKHIPNQQTILNLKLEQKLLID
jgi:hypothetical protein